MSGVKTKGKGKGKMVELDRNAYLEEGKKAGKALAKDLNLNDEEFSELVSDLNILLDNESQKTDISPKRGSCVFLASENVSCSSGARSSKRIKEKKTQNTQKTQNEGPGK